jgi:hypothetical protein
MLHGRAGKEPAPAPATLTTWAERAPGTASEYVRDACADPDHRRVELGEQIAAESPRWAVEA